MKMNIKKTVAMADIQKAFVDLKFKYTRQKQEGGSVFFYGYAPSSFLGWGEKIVIKVKKNHNNVELSLVSLPRYLSLIDSGKNIEHVIKMGKYFSEPIGGVK